VTVADLGVLIGCICAFFLIMLAHELRAMRREDRAIDRHEREVKLINDARAVFLGARLENDALSKRVDSLEQWREEVDERLGDL
jgi:hypothetical protein